MKRTLLSALCATALLLAACQSTTTKEAGAPVEERTPSTDATGATPSGTTGAGVSGTLDGDGQELLVEGLPAEAAGEGQNAWRHR